MHSASLDESEDGIKIARRNINNLRYVDYTTNSIKQGETKIWASLWKWNKRVKKLA